MYCSQCTFYKYVQKDEFAGNIGECRFNPPVYAKTSWDAFPIVKDASWCGKFEEKP